MKLSTYIITDIQPKPASANVLFLGRLQTDPTTTVRQVIVREGVNVTDLAMKQGEGGYVLEILLPPATYIIFCALVNFINPTECRFDQSAQASKFEFGYVDANGTRTATTSFVIQ